TRTAMFFLFSRPGGRQGDIWEGPTDSPSREPLTRKFSAIFSEVSLFDRPQKFLPRSGAWRYFCRGPLLEGGCREILQGKWCVQERRILGIGCRGEVGWPERERKPGEPSEPRIARNPQASSEPTRPRNPLAPSEPSLPRNPELASEPAKSARCE